MDKPRNFIEDDYCVICGAPIPEGQMICSECEKSCKNEDEED